MPKMKTHKGTKKRFRLSANGKALHRQAGTSHLASRMSQKRKRKLRGTAPVDTCMEPSIQKALGQYMPRSKKNRPNASRPAKTVGEAE